MSIKNFKKYSITILVIGALSIGFAIHSCGPVSHLPDKNSSTPTSLDTYSSLEDLATVVKNAGNNIVGYTSNGSENGLISMGDVSTCVVMYNGSLKCWGLNKKGQLGNGTTTNSKTPILAKNVTDKVIAVSIGYLHSCIYTYNGLKCFGGQEYGKVGNGILTDTIAHSPVPVSVAGGRPIKSMAAGDKHVCLLFGDTQSVGCFGDNLEGQLGNGTTTNSASVVNVQIGSPVKSIASGDYATCAITTNNDLYCWGKRLNTSPQKFASQVMSVSSGEESNEIHFCYISTSNGVYCFGSNNKLQLGDPTNLNFRTTPYHVSSLGNANAVVTGKDHSCAITDNYTNVYCWGDNSLSQLGSGSATPTMSATPVKVIGLPNNVGLLDIAAQDNATCVLLKNDDVYCWGNNNGTSSVEGDFLGVNSPTSSNTAIKVLNRKDP